MTPGSPHEPPPRYPAAMSYFKRPDETPCRTCHFFDGWTADDTAALCSNQACCRVRSQPENGCSFWERPPGADDEING